MFSVIMPVLNGVQLISETIESVLAQTFNDFELIIINYDSADDLKEAIEPYLCEKVTYHHIGGKKLSVARNFGIQKSTFPFIAYIDSDHLWHNDYLESMRNALTEDPSYELAYCIAEVCGKNLADGKTANHVSIGEPFSFRKLMKENYIDIKTFVHSRKALEFSGQFDENLIKDSDWDFLIRITSLFDPAFVQKTLVSKKPASSNRKLNSSIERPWRTAGIKNIG